LREWVCLNGVLMPAEQGYISVFDSAFMQGIGLFETLRSYRGHAFRLQQHIDRLICSARALGWQTLPDPEALGDSVQRVIDAVESDEARVRLTVSTGSLRAAAGDGPPELTVVASASPGGKYPAELYRKGVTVIVSRWRQSRFDPTVGHKTTSYFPRLASLREAHARSAFEALWLTPEGKVAEGAISSVFAVVNGELLTPPLDTPVLPGIARATVMELAAELRIAVREEVLTLEDLLEADEMFLTNSMIELMPVVRIERTAIGTEKPGELTLRLAEAYTRRVQRECPAR
jgi:branched-subunit amino acid aminotransferase/4-amino-4-deoxychorismate lyase